MKSEYLLIAISANVIVLLIDKRLKLDLFKKKKFWKLMLVVIILTIIVDGYFFTRPTEILNTNKITGVKIFKAPIENVLFGTAMIWLNIILFELFNKRK